MAVQTALSLLIHNLKGFFSNRESQLFFLPGRQADTTKGTQCMICLLYTSDAADE